MYRNKNVYIVKIYIKDLTNYLVTKHDFYNYLCLIHYKLKEFSLNRDKSKKTHLNSFMPILLKIIYLFGISLSKAWMTQYTMADYIMEKLIYYLD